MADKTIKKMPKPKTAAQKDAFRQEALDWLHKAGAQMQANGVEMFKACQ